MACSVVRSKRSLGAILAVVVIVASISAAMLVVRPSSSSQDITPSTDTIARLARGGIEATRADAREARVSADEATLVALAVQPKGAAALDAQLVRFSSGDQYKDRLAWAINLDPATLPLPFMGGPPESKGLLIPGPYEFMISLVDADTGIWLTSAAANPFTDCRFEANSACPSVTVSPSPSSAGDGIATP